MISQIQMAFLFAHKNNQLSINGIDYTFSQWIDGNTSNPRTFYPSENSTYTANFIGKPTNSGEYVNFGSTVGPPINGLLFLVNMI
jgi:hypothetical protein